MENDIENKTEEEREEFESKLDNMELLVAGGAVLLSALIYGLFILLENNRDIFFENSFLNIATTIGMGIGFSFCIYYQLLRPLFRIVYPKDYKRLSPYMDEYCESQAGKRVRKITAVTLCIITPLMLYLLLAAFIPWLPL